MEKVGIPSQLQQELVVPLHQQPVAQMLVEIQTPIEKPIEPQSETVDINTKKYFSPQMEKPQPMPPVSPSVDLPPKSLATALASARVYYKEIKQKQIQLLPVYLLFGLDIIEEIPPEQYESVTISPPFDIEDIWPEHCKLAIIPLRDIAQPVHEFYDLINGALTRERTTEVVQLQSSLTIPLRCSYELLRNLLSLISEFQEVCQTSLGDMIEERREIMDNLKELRKALDRVNTTMNSYPH